MSKRWLFMKAMEIKKRANPDLLRFAKDEDEDDAAVLKKKRQHLAQKVELRDF